jgi:Cof subfamily protein (haloacid dehalogenase superfamily)
VAAFACDLDGTLIGRDATLGDRTLGAIARARAAGIPTIIATGRMFCSVRPYAQQAGIREPVVCYQGAAVGDPDTGELLLHEPIELELAREAIAFLVEAGHSPNVYVGDELYVSTHTRYSARYAEFQHLRVTEVGDLLAWIAHPPTKLVVSAEPDDLPPIREQLEARFAGRFFLTTSLAHLLELGSPAVTKGTGLRFVCDHLGLSIDRVVAFGDGENDVELLQAAGFGIAVESAHPRLAEVAAWGCAGPADHGVARVIHAYLDSLAA